MEHYIMAYCDNSIAECTLTYFKSKADLKQAITAHQKQLFDDLIEKERLEPEDVRYIEEIILDDVIDKLVDDETVYIDLAYDDWSDTEYGVSVMRHQP